MAVTWFWQRPKHSWLENPPFVNVFPMEDVQLAILDQRSVDGRISNFGHPQICPVSSNESRLVDLLDMRGSPNS